jgi:hypothetical protein
MLAPKLEILLAAMSFMLLFISAVLASTRFALTARAENIARTIGAWFLG